MNDKNDKKIIATKSKLMLWISLGLIVVILAIFLPDIIRYYNSPWGVWLFFFWIPLYSILMIPPIVIFLVWLFYPKELIVFKENMLVFYPEKINIYFKNITSIKISGLLKNNLNVYCNDKKIKIRFTKNTRKVVVCIENLILNAASHKSLSNQG